MPKNVQDALAFAGKVGFISRKIWGDFFAQGNLRWQQRQLKKLIETNFLQVHATPAASDIYVLTPKAKLYLDKENLGYSQPPFVSQVCHDEFVARSLLRLERSSIVAEWSPESELKRIRAMQFDLGESAREQKYPDAIFKIYSSGRVGTFAFEYERTLKASKRYRDILWAYAKATQIDVVVFVCKDKIIENTIRARMNFLRNVALYKKVGFVDANEWIKNPEDAVIRFNSTTNTLRNLSQRKDIKTDNEMAVRMAA